MNLIALKKMAYDKLSNGLTQYSASVAIGLCGFFLIYKYVLQVFPSIMGPVLMREFQMNGLITGHLSASFLDALVITQVFVGYWLDRYNATRLTVGAILLCSLGALTFSFSHTMGAAMMARALMGIGGAFAAASYFKMASLLVDARYFSFVSGLLATAVTLGMIIGQVPLAWFAAKVDWRYILWVLSICGALLAAIFALLVPLSLKSTVRIPQTTSVNWSDVRTILMNPQNWLLTIYHGLAFAPIGVFAGMWGMAFLKESYHMDQTHAALFAACIFIGFGIGSPIIGYFADYYHKRKQFMLLNGMLVLALITPLIYWPNLPLSILGTLLFIIGFSAGALMLGFTIGKNVNSLKGTATAVTLLNTGGVAITALTEPLIGKLLDLNWKGQWIEGIRYFTVSDYQKALFILPLYLIGALIILYFIQDAPEQKK
jgi:predicted MFS family arabinose efflux permease